MANYVFNDMSRWRIIPLDTVTFQIGADYFSFYNLKSASQFSFSQILRSNDKGLTQAVAYRWKLDALLLQNDVHTLREYLHRFSTEALNPSETIIHLQAIQEQVNGSALTFVFNAASPTVHDAAVVWSFKADESGETVALSLNGIMSVDALSSAFIVGGASFQ